MVSTDEFAAKFVDIPRFLQCCRECRNYGKKWTCPPYDFDPEEIWSAYSKLTLIGCRILPDNDGEDLIRDLFQVKEQLFQELLRMEASAPGSMLLSAGACEFCDVCRKEAAEPCCHPERMRYSLESLGANVGAAAEELLGIKLRWFADGHRPEYLALICGLLEK